MFGFGFVWGYAASQYCNSTIEEGHNRWIAASNAVWESLPEKTQVILKLKGIDKGSLKFQSRYHKRFKEQYAKQDSEKLATIDENASPDLH